jgi:hypothetical protein
LFNRWTVFKNGTKSCTYRPVSVARRLCSISPDVSDVSVARRALKLEVSQLLADTTCRCSILVFDVHISLRPGCKLYVANDLASRRKVDWSRHRWEGLSFSNNTISISSISYIRIRIMDDTPLQLYTDRPGVACQLLR